MRYIKNVVSVVSITFFSEKNYSYIRQLGIGCKIVSRQSMLVAPVADFRNAR